MKKKILVACLCVALAVLTIAGTTLAYLTSQDTVTNTFTVGNVEIKLDEAKANTDGTLVEGANRVKANSYKLIPGHTYTKDPMVTVLEGEGQFTVDGTVYRCKAGESLVMPAKKPHAVYAPENFKMLLTVVFPQP